MIAVVIKPIKYMKNYFAEKNIDCTDIDFENLYKSVTLEDVGGGRKVANLTKLLRHSEYYLVRTTSNYRNCNQIMSSLHYQIENSFNTNIEFENVVMNNMNFRGKLHIGRIDFNNVLFEVYTNEYRTMGYHSDQSLDLDPNSFIALFSCYENPDHPNRILEVKSKTSGETLQILLKHKSVIIFSVYANSLFQHRIILDSSKDDTNNRWLGMTFRKSNTIVKYMENSVYVRGLNSGIFSQLRLATEIEKKEFYKHKSLENSNIKYEYPYIDYTISVGDLTQPIQIK